MSNTKCPGCDGELVPLYANGPMAKCAYCGGLVSLEDVSWGLACVYVALNKPMSKRPDMDDACYFDFDVRGRDGQVRRIHGWYDKSDPERKVLQYG